MYVKIFDTDEIDAICVSPDDLLVVAMQKMTAARIRIVMVVDAADGHFLGVLADGDIRRHVSGGGEMNVRVAKVFNSHAKTVSAPLAINHIRQSLDEREVEYLPLIVDGRLEKLYSLLPWRPANQVSAVIMAGGLGTRLRPLTDNCPKSMLVLNGRPILEYIVKHLASQGVTDLTICLNYLGDQIEGHFGDGSDFGVQIQYVHEQKRMGTGGALSLIDHVLSDPFLCINGDVLTDLSIQDVLETHRTNHWAATMVVRDYQHQVPYGVIKYDDSGSYSRTDEKPTLKFPINAGIYILSRSARDQIPRDQFFDLPSLFDTLNSQGQSVGTYQANCQWIDIGTHKEWERAQILFHKDDDKDSDSDHAR